MFSRGVRGEGPFALRAVDLGEDDLVVDDQGEVDEDNGQCTIDTDVDQVVN